MTTTELATPTAARLRRPSWRDARLLVGVGLVLAAAAIGSVVVAGADDRVPVWAAAEGLVPGQPVGADQLVRIDVQLATAESEYLLVADGAPSAIALREVRAGELVPRAAVGSAQDAARQPLVLPVDSTSAGALVEGSVVDVYVNPPGAGGAGSGSAGEYAGAELALSRAPVVDLPEEGSGLGSGVNATRAVQVMVPTEAVRDLIDQVDSGARITLVPVPGSVRAGS